MYLIFSSTVSHKTFHFLHTLRSSEVHIEFRNLEALAIQVEI